LALGGGLILEGNFRAGEHEGSLLATLPAERPTIVQVLCRADEGERRRRLRSRSNDPARHAGHRDAAQLDRVAACDSFLELPGQRLVFDSGPDSSRDPANRSSPEGVSAFDELVVSLDRLPAN